MLDTLGYPERARAAAIDEARAIVDVGPVAAALIDINLGETKGWPVADALAERGIPFAFTSGGGDAIPPVHAHRRLVTKPFRLSERSEEHTSELQSLMRISYAVFCLKKKNTML